MTHSVNETSKAQFLSRLSQLDDVLGTELYQECTRALKEEKKSRRAHQPKLPMAKRAVNAAYKATMWTEEMHRLTRKAYPIGSRVNVFWGDGWEPQEVVVSGIHDGFIQIKLPYQEEWEEPWFINISDLEERISSVPKPSQSKVATEPNVVVKVERASPKKDQPRSKLTPIDTSSNFHSGWTPLHQSVKVDPITPPGEKPTVCLMTRGSTGEDYLVDFGNVKCTCPQYTYRQKPCKHLNDKALQKQAAVVVEPEVVVVPEVMIVSPPTKPPAKVVSLVDYSESDDSDSDDETKSNSGSVTPTSSNLNMSIDQARLLCGLTHKTLTQVYDSLQDAADLYWKTGLSWDTFNLWFMNQTVQSGDDGCRRFHNQMDITTRCRSGTASRQLAGLSNSLFNCFKTKNTVGPVYVLVRDIGLAMSVLCGGSCEQKLPKTFKMMDQTNPISPINLDTSTITFKNMKCYLEIIFKTVDLFNDSDMKLYGDATQLAEVTTTENFRLAGLSQQTPMKLTQFLAWKRGDDLHAKDDTDVKYHTPVPKSPLPMPRLVRQVGSVVKMPTPVVPLPSTQTPTATHVHVRRSTRRKNPPNILTYPE